MNSTDGNRPRGNGLFCWYTHPLTTVIVVVLSTLVFAYFLGTEFAVTALVGLLSYVTACARAYKPTGTTD
ncbi:hypothetical protein [Rhodococcus tukisamuensis]|uniref:hypothetical protein n=1 Tax=Rhodococcus tukisamuensis TaxID=168276 RepID=UPI000932599A|nr:hypothetical protein [Rhodococcus tukisamuensis]